MSAIAAPTNVVVQSASSELKAIELTNMKQTFAAPEEEAAQPVWENERIKATQCGFTFFTSLLALIAAIAACIAASVVVHDFSDMRSQVKSFQDLELAHFTATTAQMRAFQNLVTANHAAVLAAIGDTQLMGTVGNAPTSIATMLASTAVLLGANLPAFTPSANFTGGVESPTVHQALTDVTIMLDTLMLRMGNPGENSSIAHVLGTPVNGSLSSGMNQMAVVVDGTAEIVNNFNTAITMVADGVTQVVIPMIQRFLGDNPDGVQYFFGNLTNSIDEVRDAILYTRDAIGVYPSQNNWTTIAQAVDACAGVNPTLTLEFVGLKTHKDSEINTKPY